MESDRHRPTEKLSRLFDREIDSHEMRNDSVIRNSFVFNLLNCRKQNAT